MAAADLATDVRDALASACEAVDDATDADAVDGVAPALVARPSDVDQVAEVLRAAAAHGLRVVPRGRGTKSTWGRPPEAVDLVLDLAGLDRVLDHAAGDLIVAVQAGATLASVQDVVSGGDQRLVLDETVPGGSIGGVLATNASGPRRLLAGTARDLLIGVTMVRADGVVAKAGGRVVKNVAGYDLGKLLVGSYGTLGVVVEATFRLHPVPSAATWVSVPAPTPAAAQELAQATVHSQVVPAAVEVDRAEDGALTVAVLLEGRPDGVAGRVEELQRLLGWDAAVGDEPPWGTASYPWETGVTGDQRSTALKATFGLSGLADVLTDAEQAGATVRGSAGVGVLHAALPHDRAPSDVATAAERLRTTCTRHGGALVVLDGPTAVKDAVDTWGPVPALALMRRVKDQFDPDRRLSPGRYVGGI